MLGNAAGQNSFVNVSGNASADLTAINAVLLVPVLTLAANGGGGNTVVVIFQADTTGNGVADEVQGCRLPPQQRYAAGAAEQLVHLNTAGISACSLPTTSSSQPDLQSSQLCYLSLSGAFLLFRSVSSVLWMPFRIVGLVLRCKKACVFCL